MKHYKNIGYFFVALFVCMFFGFYKPYFKLVPDFDPSFTLVVHIHATALILWLILLCIQPFLIRYKKLNIHRLLGKFTYFLVPVIIITSVAVMDQQYHEYLQQKISPDRSLGALLIPFAELFLFSLFYLLAMIYRHNVALHMRYIICNALVLITPSLARVTGYWFDMGQYLSYRICFVLSDMLLIFLIFYDYKKGLNYKPYAITLLLFLIFQLGWFFSGHLF